MVAWGSYLEVAEDHFPEEVSENSPLVAVGERFLGSGAVGGISTAGGMVQVLESALVCVLESYNLSNRK